MSLVTISHQVGENVQVSFDKEALKLISKVSNHPFLSNEANWEMVTIVYKHESSGKRLVSGIKNDFSKTDDVRVKSNMSGGEVYELYKILICGQDRTPIVSIKRDEITNASSMDLTLASGSGGSFNYISWNLLSDHTTEPDGGIYGGSLWAADTSNPISSEASGEFTFVINDMLNTPSDFAFGIGPQGQSDFHTQHLTNYFGLCWLYNGLRPMIKGYVDVSISAPIVTNGENTIKIAREGSSMKIYVNGNIFYTYNSSMYPNENFTSVALIPAVRTMNNAQNKGIISAYRSN